MKRRDRIAPAALLQRRIERVNLRVSEVLQHAELISSPVRPDHKRCHVENLLTSCVAYTRALEALRKPLK